MKRIKYISTVFAACMFMELSAGEITVREIPVAKQLPSNTVYRMFQDSDGFIWFGTPGGFCRYDGYEMESFHSEITNPAFPSNYVTGGFAEDTLNRTIWIGTEKGVLILDKRTHEITPLDAALLGESPIRQILYASNAIWVCSDFGLYLYNTDKTLRKKYLNGANSIYIDNRSTVWVTIWRGGIYYLDKHTDSFISCPEIGIHNNPHKIFQDNAGRLWICTWGEGLYRLYPDKRGQEMYEHVTIPQSKNSNSQIFYDIEQDESNGYLWALSYAGILIFQAEDNLIVPVNDLNGKINDLTNLFSDIMKDRDGNLWLGTYNQGAILINPCPSTVTNFDLRSIKTETGYIPNIVNVFEGKDGELWLGQDRMGIHLFNPEISKNSTINVNIPEINEITSICNYSKHDEVWIAKEYVPDIYRLRKSDGKVCLSGVINMRDVLGENVQVIQFLHEDKNGVVWAATNDILLSYQYDKWRIINSDCGTITGITEDSGGAVWLSTAKNGLLQIVPDGDDTVNIKHFNTNTCRIAGDNISCISAGAGGQLWFCVNEKQLFNYDIAEQRFTDYTDNANVDNLVIFNIIAGDNGHIWISDNKQVIEFSPLTGALLQYDAQDDLIVTSLNVNSTVQMRNGALVFGGNKGLCVFRPSPQLDMPCKKVKTMISGVKINDKPVYHRDTIQNSGWQKELVLLPSERNIEISFSSFNYLNPSKTRYAYKLEGVDEQWIYTESGRCFAVYNQLRKGQYTFLVKSTGENQLWSDEVTRLTVIKKPAFYETGWAYTGYTVITVLLLFASLRFYVNRIKLRNELHIARMDKEKSEELIQTKLRFFTNIGHEFRTPLTLIMTPLSALIQHVTDESLKQKLSSIYRNADNMLGLINQLLDFRKLEMGGEKLKLSCDDFVKFAEYVYLTFKDIAANKSIQFTFESDLRQLFMAFDKSKVRKILNNLYSNALKFTPNEGYIITTVELVQKNGREFIRIDILDSGCGIPDREQQMIFERFYQSEKNDPDKTGSGIGLHLVKEYVELHGGQIIVSSKLGKGSEFSVLIPTDLQVADDNAETENPGITDSSLPLKSETDGVHEQKTLLIVEDNAELRHFVAEQLDSKFNVLQATDGKQGLAIALKRSPDLIVSDLMMPVLDGLEMCQRLKTDIHTSHIPVILLTAKLSDETKIESYKAGADSYISKPFNFEVLLTRIEMLIEQQEKRRKLFHKTIEITPSSITTTSLDEELIKEALLIVEQNMDNSEFSVEKLASGLAFSRRQLSRKFQSITGLSPSEFIRSVRLKRAAQLLKDSHYNISEISDMVGFGSVKYFNMNFKEEFGLTPTQYRTQLKIEN
jgi:signal transduction histidine kinase/DNA-binding response OmpR family regulator/ligand-binding sensor domain-containing protein